MCRFVGCIGGLLINQQHAVAHRIVCHFGELMCSIIITQLVMGYYGSQQVRTQPHTQPAATMALHRRMRNRPAHDWCLVYHSPYLLSLVFVNLICQKNLATPGQPNSELSSFCMPAGICTHIMHMSVRAAP